MIKQGMYNKLKIPFYPSSFNVFIIIKPFQRLFTCSQLHATLEIDNDNKSVVGKWSLGHD